MKIAWIGLGTMGEFMAGHLLDAGHELTVHNRTREREEALAGRGARRAATPREAAEGAELVCICVSDSPDVEAVVLGADGIADGHRRGRRRAGLLDDRPGHRRAAWPPSSQSKGCGAVDAPGLGRLGGRPQGTADRVRRTARTRTSRVARPALEAFCRSITHLGGPGAGQAGKAVNQVLISGTYAALGEGLALGEREGLPLERARRGARRRRGRARGSSRTAPAT